MVKKFPLDTHCRHFEVGANMSIDGWSLLNFKNTEDYNSTDMLLLLKKEVRVIAVTSM